MRTVLLIVLTLIPSIAFAAATSFFGPLVPCGGKDQAMCQACDLVTLAGNLINFMIAVAVVGAALMFAYAGFLYVTASATPENLNSAKKIFWNVFIGLIFILSAWLIVNLVLTVLTGKSFSEYEIKCLAPIARSVSRDVGEIVVGGGVTPSGGLTGVEARAKLDAACRNDGVCVSVEPGISLDGVKEQTLDNALALQQACGCRVVLTSTTGGTHATGGVCTHGSGCKFDARSRDEGIPLKSWVESNLTPAGTRTNGDKLYRDGCGNVYAVEQNVSAPHIDIEAKHSCPASSIRTRG